VSAPTDLPTSPEGWAAAVAAGVAALKAAQVLLRKAGIIGPDYRAMIAEFQAENTRHREALRQEMQAGNAALVSAIGELGVVMRSELEETRREIIAANEHGRERFLEVMALLTNAMTAANTKLDMLVGRGK
jgi:hypothetical protein